MDKMLLTLLIVSVLFMGIVPFIALNKTQCCTQECCPLDCKDSDTCPAYCCDGVSKHNCKSPCCNGEGK